MVTNTTALGSCKKCQAALCLSGSDVVCMACGLPQPEHPLMRERAELARQGKAPPDPRGHELPAVKTAAVELAATWLDRILLLEKQAKEIPLLRKEIQELRAILESDGRRKRTA